MAKRKGIVYLGFEEEYIPEKNESCIDFTVNKVGGLPNWSNSVLTVPDCPTCGHNRPLILQVYAPIENSSFHRTLYIFACIKPSCSVQSCNWICLRVQVLDKVQENTKAKTSPLKDLKWFDEEDDWGEKTEQQNERNGNMMKNDNRASDEDDTSNSIESDLLDNFGACCIDNNNANSVAKGGAFGLSDSNSAYAEIEGEESEIVTVESPNLPSNDILALLKAANVSFNQKNIILKSFYITVYEEKIKTSNYLGISDRVNLLLKDYQSSSQKQISRSPESLDQKFNDNENYEKSIPAHGDVMFHNFVSAIQKYPDQILRYSRDAPPLLLNHLRKKLPQCSHCGGETIYELQILPTLIPKLYLEDGSSAPIDYGNVLIFTCIKSCWDTPDKFRVENVIVQQEI